MKLFWQKVKRFARVIAKSFMEAQVRRAEWHRKNSSFMD